MNDFAYFKENKELIAICFAVGFVFGIILPTVMGCLRNVVSGVCGFVGRVLALCLSSSYYVWLVMCCQLCLEIFLLQQWMFTYNSDNAVGGVYDKYSYLPLTVVVPLFFTNIFVFIASCCRMGDLSKDNK